jgi:hypothetical protein
MSMQSAPRPKPKAEPKSLDPTLLQMIREGHLKQVAFLGELSHTNATQPFSQWSTLSCPIVGVTPPEFSGYTERMPAEKIAAHYSESLSAEHGRDSASDRTRQSRAPYY